MCRFFTALCLLAFAVQAPSAGAWEYQDDTATVSFDANALTHVLYVITPESEGIEGTDSVLAIQRLRPKFAFTVENWLSFEASWDLMPVVGTALNAMSWAVAPSNPLRVDDLDQELHTGDGWVLRHNLDRLVLRFTHDDFELRLGRQAIGHGSARIFSASDLFANVSPASLDSEFKRGVDGLRLTVPIGETMECELYVLTNGTKWAESVYLARWRASLGAIDVSLLLGSSYKQPTLALDLSGDLLGAGWYLEGSARLDPDDTSGGNSGRFTLGADYKFSFGLQVTLEGHYNSPGGAEPTDYLAAFSSLSATVGESFLLGQWYLGMSLGYELSSLLNGRLAWMQNLDDGSALVSIFLAWEFAENVAIETGAMIPFGARLDMNSGAIPVPRSEFGLYPTMVFTALRLAL